MADPENLSDAKEDRAVVELAVNQCVRVMRRHGVTGAVVVAHRKTSAHGATIGHGADVKSDNTGYVPDTACDMINLSIETQSITAGMRALVGAFRDMLEHCKDVWEKRAPH